MNRSWMKSGESGPAHWVTLKGGMNFVTACRHIIQVIYARRVDTSAVMIGAPARIYIGPSSGEICPECEKMAKEKAK
jgi:hypothetical protein